jgi:anti-sigma B factor antagonist
MSLKMSLSRHLDVTVMELAGRVTLGEGSSLYRDAVQDALWNGQKKLALDYGDVTYQDSSGNGELVSAYVYTANAGGEMVLFDLTKRVRGLLQITKLYTCFRVFQTLPEVLAYFDSTRGRDLVVGSRSRYGKVAVLEAAGVVTEATGAANVPRAAESAVAAGANALILLCPQIFEADGAGVRHIFAARETAIGAGGDLVLVGVEDRLLTALQETGLQGLRIQKTLDEALGEFGLVVDRRHRRIEVLPAS